MVTAVQRYGHTRWLITFPGCIFRAKVALPQQIVHRNDKKIKDQLQRCFISLNINGHYWHLLQECKCRKPHQIVLYGFGDIAI